MLRSGNARIRFSLLKTNFVKPSRKWTLLLVCCVLPFLLICTLFSSHQLKYPSDWSHLWIEKAPFGVKIQKLEPNQNPPFDIYSLNHSLTTNFDCVKTQTVPRTTVCIYSEFNDKYISHDLAYTGKWEPQVANHFLEVLRRDDKVGVIDIGANIGFYTMLAAEMGHLVLAVDPVLENIYRLHRAAEMEDVQNRIVVLRNAVADVRTTSTLRRSGDNQGDTRIELGVKPCQGSCPSTVRTILLDDLVMVTPFEKAVMKMDIQGFEHKAFQYASVLFNHVNVTYIFMEWLLIKEFFISEEHKSTDKLQTEEMMKFLFSRNYRPFCLNADGGHPLNPAIWDKWPDDVIWHLLPDSDLKSKLLQNHYYKWPP